jgi:hypothetical protein
VQNRRKNKKHEKKIASIKVALAEFDRTRMQESLEGLTDAMDGIEDVDFA